MARNSGGIPGLSQAVNANRVGMGISANPSLPPGVGFGSGIPKPSAGMSLNGAAENTGGGMNSAIAGIIKSMGASGGNGPGRAKGGIKGPEKPSLGRSGAISRRLNGNPSRGTELKGL
jgi:hypothetical protein